MTSTEIISNIKNNEELKIEKHNQKVLNKQIREDKAIERKNLMEKKRLEIEENKKKKNSANFKEKKPKTKKKKQDDETISFTEMINGVSWADEEIILV